MSELPQPEVFGLMTQAPHRIRNLPRRDWRETPEESLRELDAFFRLPGSTESLRTIQAVGALECVRQGGLWLNGRVGCGKTLLSAMLATLYEDIRPLIVVPGGFEEKTEREFEGYRRHWRLTHRYDLITYNDVARDEDESLFDTYAPGILICDEVDKLRRVGPEGSATANRFAEFMAKAPKTIFVGMTGTPFKDGLKDFAHTLCWGLKDGAPCPLDPGDIVRWDTALRGKGSVRKLCIELNVPETVDDARKAFRSRLFDTPGVIISTDQFTGVPLVITRREHDAGCREALQHLAQTGERPDGWDTVDTQPDESGDGSEGSGDSDNAPGSTWAAARQLALGFFYTPDPEPPKLWAAARKAWFSFVRVQIQLQRFKTELQVRKAATAGKFGKLKAWEDWERLKPTFEPSFKPVWLSDNAINYCKQWGREPGIIWTDHRAFADRLSSETGWAWYAGGGLSVDGSLIEDARGSDTIIASRQANGTGRNLQAWYRGLITAMPGNGRDFEQQLGRQHREGARRAVEIEVLEGCGEHTRDIAKVLSLSNDEREIMGRQNKALTAAWL
jgi:hypothetical protein